MLGKLQKKLISDLCGSEVVYLKSYMKRTIEGLAKRGVIEYNKHLKNGVIQYEVISNIWRIYYLSSEEANYLNSMSRYKDLRDEPYREGYYFTESPELMNKKCYQSRVFEAFGPFSTELEAAYFWAENRNKNVF